MIFKIELIDTENKSVVARVGGEWVEGRQNGWMWPKNTNFQLLDKLNFGDKNVQHGDYS